MKKISNKKRSKLDRYTLAFELNETIKIRRK